MNDPNRNWYALFVRSRHEFVASDQLQKRGVEVLLPSLTKMRRWSDRGKAVRFPLFPGYIFVYIQPNAETMLNVVRTSGTVSFVCHEPGHPVPVDPQEIQTLKRMLDAGDHLDTYPHLCVGERVTVMRGPLTGVEGLLMKKDDQHLFLVNINILGRSVGMRINPDDLGKL
jgi:transcription termination/antitermination protein NusG